MRIQVKILKSVKEKKCISILNTFSKLRYYIFELHGKKQNINNFNNYNIIV